VKSHNDWIVDLYYKEMVNKKQEINHGKYKESTRESKKTPERDTTVSRNLQTQNYSN